MQRRPGRITVPGAFRRRRAFCRASTLRVEPLPCQCEARSSRCSAPRDADAARTFGFARPREARRGDQARSADVVRASRSPEDVDASCRLAVGLPAFEGEAKSRRPQHRTTLRRDSRSGSGRPRPPGDEPSMRSADVKRNADERPDLESATHAKLAQRARERTGRESLPPGFGCPHA